MKTLTAIILAKNEEKIIAKAVESLLFCGEVLVIDDESTDETAKRAISAGAKVMSHSKKREFAGQRNWAMEQAESEWILFIDADEQVTDELKKEILLYTSMLDRPKIVAYALPRRDFFWDTELKFGETYKARTSGIVRLVKKDGGVWAGAVHERFVPTGSIEKLDGYIDHYSHETLSSFIQDINVYSSIRAEELAKEGKKFSLFELVFFPFFKFIYTYFILRGFLDGAAGFVYSFVMSFHSFLVRAKLATKSYV
jgi:glycosyltransferase involved in cell wall biosynthesis